jgi:Mg2+ and Co2+ transporter CorA
VEDVEQRLQDRLRWASQMMQDYASTLAQRQGEQIDRLTIVSIIFLPITFLTGFFGMNFSFLVSHIGTTLSFAIGMGVMGASIVVQLAFFKRRGWL